MPRIDDASLNSLIAGFGPGVNERHFALLAEMIKRRGYRPAPKPVFYVNYSVTGIGSVGTFRQALTANSRRTSLMVSASVNTEPPTFATWDPAATGVHAALSNGNLTLDTFADFIDGANTRTTVSHSSGKWYVEITVNGDVQIGVGTSATNDNTDLRFQPATWVYAGSSSGNQFWHNGVITSFYGSGWNNTNIVNFKIDIDGGILEYGANGVYYGALPVGFAGNMFIVAGGQIGQNGGPTTLNAGQSPFVYPVPAGYNAGFYAGTTGVTVPKILLDGAPLTETAYSSHELARAIPMQCYDGTQGIYQFFIPRNAPTNPISVMDLASSAGSPTAFTLLEGYSV